VKDGISGFTTDVGDTDAMAWKAIEILKNATQLKKLSESSRTYALENFHENKIIPQYIKLYEKLLS
jgi:glycosyltransferase involved in cell wall biosynthesis